MTGSPTETRMRPVQSKKNTDRASLYRYNALLSDVKDKFQESETFQLITRLDSSVTVKIAWNASSTRGREVSRLDFSPGCATSIFKIILLAGPIFVQMTLFARLTF